MPTVERTPFDFTLALLSERATLVVPASMLVLTALARCFWRIHSDARKHDSRMRDALREHDRFKGFDQRRDHSS